MLPLQLEQDSGKRTMNANQPATGIRLALGVRETARLLGVSTQTVRNLYRSGELEGYQLNQKMLIYCDSAASLQKRKQPALSGDQPSGQDSPKSNPPRFASRHIDWDASTAG
jgi:excisionase family DNA binding protein